MLRIEPALPMLRIEPALPMLKIEPEVPILKIEPTLPMLRIEPALPMLPTLLKLRMLHKLPALNEFLSTAPTTPRATALPLLARVPFTLLIKPSPNPASSCRLSLPLLR
jgi:hypothetical protein